MSEESETPLGVKMLADHLVKVKLQYEERINELLLHIRGIEKEKVELQRKFKQVEDELELRRNEIFQMKREASAQYVIEERENWKAMLNQEKRLNEKLNKDMEIYKSRIVLLEEQLKNELEAPMNDSEEESEIMELEGNPSGLGELQVLEGDQCDSEESQPVEIQPDFEESHSIEIQPDSEKSQPIDNQPDFEESHPIENHLILTSATCIGPPQPELPPTAEIDEVSIETLLQQKEELEKEIQTIQQSIQKLQQELEESKQINLRLTDQFIHKVDSLEADHKERENALLNAIEGLKAKLDIELEKKWELTQKLKDEEQGRSGLLSFLWG